MAAARQRPHPLRGNLDEIKRRQHLWEIPKEAEDRLHDEKNNVLLGGFRDQVNDKSYCVSVTGVNRKDALTTPLVIK